MKQEGNQGLGCVVLIVIVLFIGFCMDKCGCSTSPSDRIAGTGPSEHDVVVNIRLFLKNRYLKDPGSYDGMEWGPSGIYMKENNTYFMMHKFRAKNSFGGYVVENPMFILNEQGEVLDVKTDIYDIINDNGY